MAFATVAMDQAIACQLAAKLVVRAKIKDVDAWLARAGLMYGGGLLGWIDERIGQLTERYVSDLDEAEAKQ
eukprot:7002418-Lingulodinium_polyedra.AAC.1